MRDYEAMVIVDARLDEGDLQKAVDRVSSAITDGGGEVIGIDRWGVRRFAYEIDHRREGYYFVTNFRAEEDVVDNLTRLLRISDEYVRGKIVRPEPDSGKQSSRTGSGRQPSRTDSGKQPSRTDTGRQPARAGSGKQGRA